MVSKLVCEIEENDYTINIFLFSYDGDINEGYIWVHSFVKDHLSVNDRSFLNKIKDISIPEDNPRYKQLSTLATNLDNMGYNSLMTFQPKKTFDLNLAILQILQSFISTN